MEPIQATKKENELPEKLQIGYNANGTVTQNLITDTSGHWAARCIRNDHFTAQQSEALAAEIVKRYNAFSELFQMVRDLKKCIQRLSNDDLSQFDRDTETQWEGEAHDLLTRINPNYYKNAKE